MAMRQSLKTGLLAAAIALIGLSAASAQTAAHHPKAGAAHKQTAQQHHGYGHRGGRVGFAPGMPGHYVNLVGDPRSGLGFYPLPPQIRAGAERYRWRTARPPWANPVHQAVAADAARYWYWVPTEATSYRYGVFDPNDGVGTPFFAGYYSAGGTGYDDDDDDTPLFARPLTR